MPARPLSPCTVCGAPCSGGKCEAHKKAHRRAQDEARGPDRQWYGNARWRKAREDALSRDGHLCQMCQEQGLTVVATVVDHIKDRKDYPELAYVLTNLRALCKPCHDSRTARERGFGRLGQGQGDAS